LEYIIFVKKLYHGTDKKVYLSVAVYLKFVACSYRALKNPHLNYIQLLCRLRVYVANPYSIPGIISRYEIKDITIKPDNMNISEFNRLENDHQIELVWQKGEIVSSRLEGFYKYLLLQLYSFYVEIRFDTRINVLEFETHSVNAYQIEPYLEKINIDMLLEEAGSD